jgi:hypothetical protein
VDEAYRVDRCENGKIGLQEKKLKYRLDTFRDTNGVHIVILDRNSKEK